MLTYRLRLLGPEARGARIGAALLKDILDVMTEGAKGAVRLRAEGRSSARGLAPAWVGKAADFDVVGLAAGSTVLLIEAKTLHEAAPERFGQGDFLLELDPNDSAIGLLEQSLSEALEGKTDSELFDEALLGKFEDLGDVFAHRVETIELTNGRSTRPLIIDRARFANVPKLRRETPPAQAARVAGWLDAIRHSDRMFTLKLESGTTLRGVAEAVPTETLAGLFGRKAMVSGTAVFRPSGAVLRIEAEHIEPAGEDVAFWSVEPRPLRGGEESPLRVNQGPRSGLNAILGQWPGDESDEQIARALEDLS